MELLRAQRAPARHLPRATRSTTRSPPPPATGGSTNSVLHLLGDGARSRRPADDRRLRSRQRAHADHRRSASPGGQYVALDVDNAGGIAGDRAADDRRRTGRRLASRRSPATRFAEEAADASKRRPARRSSRRLSNPFKKHRRARDPARQSLSPDGAVVKVAGHERNIAARAARACSTAKKMPCTPCWPGEISRRRRRRDPLRRPEGRPRHARNARRHRGDRRREAWVRPSRWSPTAVSAARRAA